MRRRASVVSIMRPPCWRRRRSCHGPTPAAAACSGSTTACTGDTAPSAGGRPAPASRSSSGRSSRRTPPGATPSGRSRGCVPPGPSTFAGVLGLSSARLSGLIRPSGTFRVKARRLRAFARHVARRHRGRLGRLLALPLPALRAELRGDRRHRTGDGRRHRALCRGPADLRRRRLHAADPGAAPAGRARRGLRDRADALHGAPAPRSRALQRVPRAPGPRRQGALPDAAALRGLPAPVRPSRPAAPALDAARRPPLPAAALGGRLTR